MGRRGWFAAGPLATLARLWRTRRGATAVLFALTIIPVTAFVALAFDIGSVVWARSQLDLAADAAALTGVMTGANDFAANPNTSFQPAQEAASKRFYAQANQMPQVSVTALGVSVTRSGGKITATVTYTASYNTRFAGVLGVRTLPAAGVSTITRTSSPFFDIEFLVDDSSSMGIGASQADMDRLGVLVSNAAKTNSTFKTPAQGQNCAFGCHWSSTNNDFYGLAKSNGVSLRIDVLSQAVQNVITTIQSSPSAAQFQVGITSLNTGYNAIYPTSSDLSDAILAVQRMSVTLTPLNTPEPDTNLPLALASAAADLPAGGDGSTPSAPLRYLFIVTDGVTDYINGSGTRIMAPLDPTECAAIKAKNIQVLTLYTEYIPLDPPYVPTANAFYDQNIKPFQGNLFPNLQACASSPAFAFEATDGTSINTALQAMLQAALSTPARFTQ